MVGGRWTVVSGRWSVVGGRRSVVGGRWGGVGGRGSVVGGRRSVVGGRRSVVGGRRSVVGGRRSATLFSIVGYNIKWVTTSWTDGITSLFNGLYKWRRFSIAVLTPWKHEAGIIFMWHKLSHFPPRPNKGRRVLCIVVGYK